MSALPGFTPVELLRVELTGPSRWVFKAPLRVGPGEQITFHLNETGLLYKIEPSEPDTDAEVSTAESPDCRREPEDR